MVKHMSLRLAWHNDGWNGHICKNPCKNVYCVGQHSYPRGLIAEKKDLEYETAHAGESCASHPCKIPCALSANAFGKETIQVKQEANKSWYEKNEIKPTIINLPPYTACTWCYEVMYKSEESSGKNNKIDRRKNAEAFFSQFEEGKSLIFYYSGYSNPFSENEENNHVIVGISRLKKIGNFYNYENIKEQIKRNHDDGLIWQKPITSNYPDEGLVIPYWKYMDNEDVLNRLVIKPLHRSPFKYASREVENDDAIEIINQMINTVEVLIEVNDDTENWKERKKWLNTVLAELWKARGPYPGFASTLKCLGLEELIKDYISLTDEREMKRFRDEVNNFFDEKTNEIFGHKLNNFCGIRRKFKLRDEEEQKLLLDIFPRFDISASQMENILREDREKTSSITAPLADILNNPYIIFEQYQGIEEYDTIPLYKIDNGVIVSPEYGIENIFAVDCPERLRAFCVDELNKIEAHSFAKAETILNQINTRLDTMPEWKKCVFKLKYFKIDKEIYNQALFFQENKEKDLYLYLKWVHEDEHEIESVLSKLADRPDISLRMAISHEKFKDRLRNKEAKINEIASEQYEKILDSQADICMQIFSKPICVLSGAAGTGKTTVVKSILEVIEKVKGLSTSFLLLAPTGKATERIKLQTDKRSSTIHSLLASNGWLNENLTLKRKGGKINKDVNTIIIDECSMIDLNLFATLLRSINWNTVERLILVGDPNQLPPIGKGKVFSDIIEWLRKKSPENVGVLTKNIRQFVNTVEGNGKGILELADLYIQEKQSDTDLNNSNELKKKKEELFTKIIENGNGDIDKDLAVYFWKEKEDLEKLLKKVLIQDMVNITGIKEYKDTNALWGKLITQQDKTLKPDVMQIISPYRGEYFGTGSLNSFIQRILNPHWIKQYNLDGITYWDKVIQIRNRPKSNMAYAFNFVVGKPERHEIYNGEIGMVRVHPFDKTNYNKMNKLQRFQVNFSNKNRKGLGYSYGQELGSKNYRIPEQKVSENLELAYAISVHKSQGSEFDYVYIVIPKKNSRLLSMELSYTAITRAQKKVTIFVQDDITTLSSLSHIEKSALRRINSSIFEFKPLPEELIYNKNWYDEKEKMATLSEYYVRSKSEVIIANMLTQENVPFVYEEPLFASDGTMYLPDFTVTFRGEKYYWEHVGRLDLPEYKAHWEKKKIWYEKHFPGQLITTYEGKDLSKEAMKIIKNKK